MTRGKPPGHARAFGHPVPHSGYGTRRQVALPRSRVPPVKTCPALRPRWCPAHSPSRTQDCCLPALANRRLPTTIHISGLNHAAYLLATPGFVRPLAGRHAGSLLTCWLDVSQVGLAPGAHPLGNNNPFHGVTSNPKVSGLPWREQGVVRRRTGHRLRSSAPSPAMKRVCTRQRSVAFACLELPEQVVVFGM